MTKHEDARTLTYEGFNLSLMVDALFPQNSVVLHIHKIIGAPMLKIYVDAEVYSNALLQMAYVYLANNIAAPIYRATGSVAPFLINVMAAPVDKWPESGYNEFDEHPDGFDTAEAFYRYMTGNGPNPAEETPLGTVDWFGPDVRDEYPDYAIYPEDLSDDDEPSDSSDSAFWGNSWRDQIGDD